MDGPPAIRGALAADLPALKAILDDYIRDSHVTFDTEPMPLTAWEARLERFAPSGPHRLLVADSGGVPLGFAQSQPFRHKAAYASTVETSIYLAPAAAGRGLGRALYAALFAALEREALHRAVAVVALPNPASVALHRGLGFRSVGVFRELGFKLGRFWDVEFFERALGD